MNLKKKLLQIGVLIGLAISGCQPNNPPRIHDLTTNWQFKQLDTERWRDAEVPGVVHTDLLNLDLIPDPFVGTNEDSVQWIEDRKWEYKTNFIISKNELDYTNADLVFEGLDTYAEVLINGKTVLEADNSFRKWETNILEFLREGENELRVIFTPPVETNKEKIESLGYKLPAGSETVETKVSPFTRKAGYQFGWDFAPRLVSMGIWKPVYINFWEGARIEDIRFELIRLDELNANYTAYISVFSDQDKADYTLEVLGSTQDVVLNSGKNNLAIDFIIKEPKLWWPNGWGEPYLYDITAMVKNSGAVADSLTKRLGVRTIELVQDIDSKGRSFNFKVNGSELFIKGANWSPLSSFPSSVPDSTYTYRLDAVVDANMNMLRVWGGGIYERDLFYDLCDEKGILIWQDFMFANSMYPGDDEFVTNVQEEVVYQINRLASHPSLAIWNGNNEIDVAWKNWGWQEQFGYSKEDSAKIRRDYDHLFRQMIPELINSYDPGRSYTHTSPLSNWGKPENFNSGSMHYWGVWHGGDGFEDYKDNVGRFMAEYGFQSFPEMSTMILINNQEELTLLMSDKQLHQKSYIGNGLIIKKIERRFGNINSFESFLQKSQKNQALAYKMAIEAHRINRATCGGTMFWQLNDCWPGPSWSVIDYYGRKKVALDIVKDRYKPVILVMNRTVNDFEISVVNDMLNGTNAKLKLELFMHNNDRLWVTEKRIEVQANSATRIYRSDTRKLLDGAAKAQVYLKATLISNDKIIDIEKFYFVLPKDYLGEIDLIGE